MVFDSKRQKLAETIAPAVESITNMGAIVAGLAIVAIVVSVVALAVAAKAGKAATA